MSNYEIPHDGIVYFPGVIKDIDSLLEKIELTNSIAITPWEVWYASGAADGYAYGEVKAMSKQLIQNEIDPTVKEDSTYVINTLIDAMSDCAKEYAGIYNISSDSLDYALFALNMSGTRYGINKYYENMFMGPHVDWNEHNFDITYTIVVYLNDDYEGGELYFVDDAIDLKIKPKKGSIVMFPSILPYIHQSCNIPVGRKMLITHHWKNDSLLKLEDLQ
jgi:hypothetical protein